ncbi:prephenate dehydratase [Pseudoclavibacter caeni]|jgi:prephenate dehydratase|uniref:Prephenate dehydratase n=1 Tax=Pseudoclavibacter caeni TaxID=908846 RepID=A0A7C8BSZ5_9MICO|nr:prephenate dehydratase [Pseudoclavibacter caeni]KAB1633546.1 prephenate dehydratase [Pseudoclavibacter caeni]NYJ96451.1 prephenate dehydratase [Pseudoclavibacter caeni]
MGAAETSMVYSYLGPAGTFTEDALRGFDPDHAGEWRPVASIVQAIDDVAQGRSDRAVIPIENSVEGGVTATLDALATMTGVRIRGERTVPITFHLLARPGVRLADVRRIATHPMSYPQCRGWLAEHVPGHQFVPAPSNAAAAASALHDETIDAAIAGERVLDHYGLEVLARGIGDNANAVTRFVLLGPDHGVPEPTGADKTSLIVELPVDEAGALLRLLEQFSTRGINMTRIESRPIGDELGRYRFSIDLEGHVCDARVAEALRGVYRFSPRVVFLGSYPRANGRAASVQPGQGNADHEAARRWVEALLR